MASMIDSPFDRTPKKVSRWPPIEIENCGCRKSVSGGSVMFSQYLRIYRDEIRPDEATRALQGNRARLPPWTCSIALSSPRATYGLLPKLPCPLLSRKKSSKSFVVLGIRLVLVSWKANNTQKTTTDTLHLVNRLGPKNDMKQYNLYETSKIDNIIVSNNKKL